MQVQTATTTQSNQSRIMHSSPRLVSICEEMNPSKRSTMEDCCVYAKEGTWDGPSDVAFLGVYDGHGGRDMVEYLEEGLQWHVAQELRCTDDNATIATRLERAFLMADIHSKQLGVSMSGATVAMCLVKKHSKEEDDSALRTLYAANAGDARIVLGHQGKAQRLTHDHKPDDPSEIGRIEKAGGFMFKQRVVGVLAVTRSLGDHCMKDFVIAKPYCSELTIRLDEDYSSSSSKESKEDCESLSSFLILACDGLWDVFEDQQAVDMVWEHADDPENVAKYLVKEALARGSTDNISVIVAWL
mmetsp:Transcript_19826/g.48714  ORF Transcript_19826/g.48714 Transcript_19826/m.48714 type:complete len:300 (+) Transcript_19826:192-1091(+)